MTTQTPKVKSPEAPLYYEAVPVEKELPIYNEHGSNAYGVINKWGAIQYAIWMVNEFIGTEPVTHWLRPLSRSLEEETAVGFAEWTEDNGWSKLPGEMYWTKKVGSGIQEKDGIDLFTLYKKEKQ